MARHTIGPDLMRLSDKEFDALVNQDLRDRVDETGLSWGEENPELKMALRSPEVVRRWYISLLGMQKSLEGYLAARRSDLTVQMLTTSSESQRTKMRLKHEQWRSNALRVKIYLELRLLEARTLLEKYGDSYIPDQMKAERNAALARTDLLEKVILRHHQNFPAEDDPSDLDLELWSYVRDNND